MKHTPGPWEFIEPVQIVESARPHMRIAFLPSNHHEIPSARANGRLIAAAPEMLRALKAALPKLGSDENREVREIVEAAIAKAHP